MRKYKKPTVFNFSLLFLIIAALSSCVKSRDGETSFDGLQPFVLIREGGLATFGNQALTFPASDSVDTAYFRVNYAAKTVAPTDITVTLAYDDNARTSYNSSLSSSDSPYTKFPDSIYSFTSTSVTIKAGQQFSDLIPLVVYPNKVNGSKNYMFPITITAANGASISGNFGTIYYHFIGNPLAGKYKHSFRRYNGAPDTTGTVTPTISEETVAPVNGTTLLFPQSYFIAFATNGKGYYSLSFDQALTTFTASFANPDNVKAGGFSIVSGPTLINPIIAGTASNGYAGSRFEFYTNVLNSSGADRKLIDVYTKE